MDKRTDEGNDRCTHTECIGTMFTNRNAQTQVLSKWLTNFKPITVAARSKAWTVFARSNAGIVGSYPTQGMDVCIVCVYSVFVVFCV
jgi:hypothetical protein